MMWYRPIPGGVNEIVCDWDWLMSHIKNIFLVYLYMCGDEIGNEFTRIINHLAKVHVDYEAYARFMWFRCNFGLPTILTLIK